jgi:FKBP-type peptidyl-prolyl cis-trans isomerase
MEDKKKNNMILGAVGVVIVAIIVLILAGNKNTVPNAALANQTNQNQTSTMETKTLPDGLEITDEIVGTGTEAVAGEMVTVNYVGTLSDGTVFDASANHGNQGFTFLLGAGRVIKGWDEGVLGMKVGGKRKLVIPPSLAYGPNGVPGVIPPNATLTFEVELLSVQSQG